MSKRSVFLSSGARDKVVARRVESELKRLGLNAFNPDREVRPGDDWRKAVQAAIRRADALILVATTPQSAEASWMGYEAGMAEALGKRVMFLLPKKYPATALPADLGSGHLLAFDPKSPKQAARVILDQLALDDSADAAA